MKKTNNIEKSTQNTSKNILIKHTVKIIRNTLNNMMKKRKIKSGVNAGKLLQEEV